MTRRRCWHVCGPRIPNRRSSRHGVIRSCSSTTFSGQTEQEVSSRLRRRFRETNWSLCRLDRGRAPWSRATAFTWSEIDRRVESRVPNWQEVGGRVISDMEFEAKASSRNQLYQEIAQNYEIVFNGQVRDLLETIE